MTFFSRSKCNILVSSACFGFMFVYPALADSPRPFPLPLSGSRAIPLDVDNARVARLDAAHDIVAAQREFDILAWQAFLALNQPLDADGNADRRKDLTDSTADRVWASWRNAHTVFLPDGAQPAPWSNRPPASNVLDLSVTKAAWRQHATSADENFQAFSGPLVDQAGHWARYQVLLNKPEFDYIYDNKLFDLEGQVAFTAGTSNRPIEFPVDDPILGRNGAIEIKLAWKELSPEDDRSRFFVRRVHATLSEPPLPGHTNPPTRDYDAGLVGMHISMRTRSSRQWVWATFEQVDNTCEHDGQPATSGCDNKDESGHPVHLNFFKPGSQPPYNQLPPRNAVIDATTHQPRKAVGTETPTTWLEDLTTSPVEVTRVVVKPQPNLNDQDAMLEQSTAALNSEVQAALRKLGRGSVFRFYRLIGTQWPVQPGAPAFAGGAGSSPDSIRQKMPGAMKPVFLVNTTMETYFQKGEQPAGPLEQDDRLAEGAPPIDSTMVDGTESCVGCHYSAGAAIGFRLNADGTRQIDPTGHPIPIFGENGNFGVNGNASFSWLLQIEAQSAPVDTKAAAATPPKRSPAHFLDIAKFFDKRR